MTEVVVVGVDDSPTARKAALKARDLALALSAHLHVVTAFGSERGEVVGTGSDRLVVSEASKAEDGVVSGLLRPDRGPAVSGAAGPR